MTEQHSSEEGGEGLTPWGYLSTTGEVECTYLSANHNVSLTIEASDGESAGTIAAEVVAVLNDRAEVATTKNQRDLLALAMWDVRKSLGFDTDGDDRYHTQDFGHISESFRRDMAEVRTEIVDLNAEVIAAEDRAESAEAERDDLRGRVAAVERVASKVKREANEQWTDHNKAHDSRDLDTANRHDDVAEILDETHADLRAALANSSAAQGGGEVRVDTNSASVRVEWGVMKRSMPGVIRVDYGEDEGAARRAAPLVIGTGAVVVRRTVTTSDWFIDSDRADSLANPSAPEADQ